MVALVLAAALATAPPPQKKPNVLRDAALASAASVIVALAKPDIRRAILHDGRFRNIAHNFANPIEQVRLGTERDDDPFWVNNVAHPVSFALEGLYLKHQGYGNVGAFAFTQVHSFVWEFVVEGCAFPPSGKDLLTDAAGAAAAIWIIHPHLGRKTELAVSPARAGGVEIHFAARF